MNLENYSSWLVTWRFRVTPEEPELLSDIRDFTSRFYVILRCKFSELLGSDLGMWFAIWSIDLAIVNFKLPSNTVSNVRTGHHKKEYHTLLFSWFGKTKFLYPWTVILYFLGSLVNRARDSPCTTLGASRASHCGSVRQSPVLYVVSNYFISKTIPCSELHRKQTVIRIRSVTLTENLHRKPNVCKASRKIANLGGQRSAQMTSRKFNPRCDSDKQTIPLPVFKTWRTRYESVNYGISNYWTT